MFIYSGQENTRYNMKLVNEPDVKFLIASLQDMRSGILTPEDWNLQILMPTLRDGAVSKHVHLPVRREINAPTSECWVCISGSCQFSIYSANKNLVYNGTMKYGDLVLVEVGGNAIDCASSDFNFIEIKVGPYVANSLEKF